MRRVLFSMLLVLLVSLPARTQNNSSPVVPSAPAPLVVLGKSVVVLNGPWKFSIGDEADWADPGFNDANWETADLAPKAGSFDPTTGWGGFVAGWTAQGHPDYSGFAWYRIRVQLNAQPGESFAVVGPANVNDAYQVFANGKLLGSFGTFPTDGQPPVAYATQPAMFAIPAIPAGSTDLVLAFRVWMSPHTLTMSADPGGFHNPPQVGDAASLSSSDQLLRLALGRTYTFAAVVAAFFFLLAILAFSFAAFDDGSDMVYWWLGGLFLLIAIERANFCLMSWTQAESITAFSLLSDVFFGPLILAGWVMVWAFWFRLRDTSWLPRVVTGLTLALMICTALGEDIFFTIIPHPISAVFHLASLALRIIFLLPLVYIFAEGVSEQRWEALLALPPIILVGIAQFQNELAVYHYRANWFPFGVQVSIGEVASLALAAAIFVLLLRRLQLSMHQQQELVTEVKDAQEVQQILIPLELPRVPGLAFASEYRPAREVGGDFFQIIRNSDDGSALIVAGDVTGKGLKAGMLGALIVGSIRTEAARLNDPMAVLGSLNALLYRQGHATCLAMRIARDGSMVLANAGHLPPYLNGKEMPMEGAIPLGIVPNPEFSVMTFQLEPSDQLFLLSDGIAEAQNEQGKLFGFDRIRNLLQKPITAAQIADAAQAFGQQDDISVLSITRQTIPGEPIVWRERPSIPTTQLSGTY